MLKYMLCHGYSASDKYDGRTLRENAVLDANTAAIAVIDAGAAAL